MTWRRRRCIACGAKGYRVGTIRICRNLDCDRVVC